jgi:dTDP-4-dehydrorhamnose reductase
MTVQAIGRCEMAAQGRELVDVLADVGGVYHAAGAGETTWYGFAVEAVRLQREAEPGVRFAEIEAITTAEYPTPAKRPLNSRMDCSKLAEGFGWTMMDWQETLRKVLSAL